METRSGRKLSSANTRTAKALPLPPSAEETHPDAAASASVSTVPPIAVSARSTSTCSRSSATVRAKKLAAEALHAQRLAKIELEAAEARRRVELEVARKKYNAEIAEIEAASCRGSRSSDHASIGRSCNEDVDKCTQESGESSSHAVDNNADQPRSELVTQTSSDNSINVTALTSRRQSNISNILTAEDLNLAESHILRRSQEDDFQEEIAYIANNRPLNLRVVSASCHHKLVLTNLYISGRITAVLDVNEEDKFSIFFRWKHPSILL
ncbi:uncharacterized protein LOC128201890 [Galleria mellonella]|uniref:Uncharacterized protein LOC128201890 n=1 Tax=Galleria mellonella TaxID=7137 RepID=A0ABM3MXW1_GALME|nr:uncharacterized protein LOC128201890 [Galleria mellonella]